MPAAEVQTMKPNDLVQYRNDACRGWLGRVVALSAGGQTAFVKVMMSGEAKQKPGQVVTVRVDALEVTT